MWCSVGCGERERKNARVTKVSHLAARRTELLPVMGSAGAGVEGHLGCKLVGLQGP